jgi:hypothetical protein
VDSGDSARWGTPRPEPAIKCARGEKPGPVVVEIGSFSEALMVAAATRSKSA